MVLEELVLENYRPGSEQSKKVAVRNAKVSSLPGKGRFLQIDGESVSQHFAVTGGRGRAEKVDD